MGWLATDLERIAALNGDTLALAWAETFATPVPVVAPSLLRRALAYGRQERKFGGLPLVVRKQLESVSAHETAAMPEPPLKLKSGTRLMREWNGTMYSVLVTLNSSWMRTAHDAWRPRSPVQVLTLASHCHPSSFPIA